MFVDFLRVYAIISKAKIIITSNLEWLYENYNKQAQFITNYKQFEYTIK